MKASYEVIFKKIIKVVSYGNTALDVMDVLVQQGLVEGKLNEPIEWIFNFDKGGWNTVYAISKEEAQEKMKAEYESLTPLYDSVRPSTEKDYKMNMMNFD